MRALVRPSLRDHPVPTELPLSSSQPSVFDVRCSTLHARRWTLNVQSPQTEKAPSWSARAERTRMGLWRSHLGNDRSGRPIRPRAGLLACGSSSGRTFPFRSLGTVAQPNIVGPPRPSSPLTAPANMRRTLTAFPLRACAEPGRPASAHATTRPVRDTGAVLYCLPTNGQALSPAYETDPAIT